MSGALTGIRVIDFGQYIAGPLAAMMLGDQGADVIRVDPPGGPRWKHPSDALYSRGKRRITLDLKQPDDLRVAQRLIDSADIVIENFRPGVMERLGVGPAAMRERNPRLIYVSMPGFGEDDPRCQMEAWEGILDAATENTWPKNGEPPKDHDWTTPTYSAVTLASNFAAFLGALGSVMALIGRHRTGLGQRLEVPLFDAMFTQIGPRGAYVESRGLRKVALDSFGTHNRGAGSYRCADGKYVQFDTSSARHLIWFARAAGITDWGPDLLDINRLRDQEKNLKLIARLEELFLTRPAEEWETIGREAGAAIGMCRTPQEWLATDHAKALGASVEFEDPELGPTRMAGLPGDLSETPGQAKGPRHRLDEDRAAILAELESLQPRPAVSLGEPPDTLPLQGMRVLDLCLALAGPTCGRLLGEFGAEVIKINAPQSGGGRGYLNRGKRSILMDLANFEAQEVFWRLADESDVILQNMSPGTLDRLGLGYPEAKARKPDIVYTSISCYGSKGPWSANGRGWERQGQAVSGIMERAAKKPAVLGPYNPVDIGTGTLATFMTAVALYHRVTTGAGQEVTACLAQTGTYQQTPYMLDFKGYVPTEARGYHAIGEGPERRFYRGQDGKWFFLAVSDKTRALMPAIPGLESTAGLERTALEQAYEAVFAKAPAHEWAKCLQQAGVAAHELVDLRDLMRDDYVKARGLSVTQETDSGPATMPGISIRSSGSLTRLGFAAHLAGSDVHELLDEIGLGDQLLSLERRWVLQAGDFASPWGGGSDE
ncbi:MAG TPA: CoA transferase [Dehalococcoidia bacterium]|nr:CoA transferase [Dehalococcoidia bacterium]